MSILAALRITEGDAYTLTPLGILSNAVTRNSGATWFIPTEDEWYKAAYHDQTAGLAAVYFDYTTGTNSVPGNDIAEATNPGNNANYYNNGYAIGSPYYRTVGGEFELSHSPYGTFDQGGNVFEWNETKVPNSSRGLRGGSFHDSNLDFSFYLRASFRDYIAPSYDGNYVGFRIASIPEPSTLLLLCFGSLAVVGHPPRPLTPCGSTHAWLR